MKKIKTKVIVIVVLLALIVGAGIFAYSHYTGMLKPASDKNEVIAFEVKKGSTANSVAEELYEKGLIRETLSAKIWIRLNKAQNIYAGNYLLNRNMSVPEIFATITNDRNAIIDEVQVTIIEGAWAKDAAERIAEVTNLTADEIMKKWNSIDYIKSLFASYPFLSEDVFNSQHCFLEGFIYPETYRFFKNTTVEQVTEKILDQSLSIYEKYSEKMKKSELSVFEIYTLASVVTFEADSQEDMNLVAGVFYNRLAKGMKMGSSVTVCYALYDDFHTWQDCERNPDIDSPYNTYMYPGLPVGPICNPDEGALKAVLDPTASEYLYFMSNIATGKMYYAKTYEEHLENVRKYLK